MRGGVRLPAVVVVIGLLAGCSDPAGAVRRERAAARKSSPSPTATAKKTATNDVVAGPGPGEDRERPAGAHSGPCTRA